MLDYFMKSPHIDYMNSHLSLVQYEAHQALDACWISNTSQQKILLVFAHATPNRLGQFTIVYYREHQYIRPFTVDEIDILLVMYNDKDNHGCFFFDKQTLIARKLTSHGHVRGKLGFRVFGPMCECQGHALSTQRWQNQYYKSHPAYIDILSNLIHI